MIDVDVFQSPGFVILLALAWGATILGYIFSVKSDLAALPIWQLLIIMLFEAAIAYFFAAKE